LTTRAFPERQFDNWQGQEMTDLIERTFQRLDEHCRAE
jgi:hypothetical protein